MNKTELESLVSEMLESYECSPESIELIELIMQKHCEQTNNEELDDYNAQELLEVIRALIGIEDSNLKYYEQ